MAYNLHAQMTYINVKSLFGFISIQFEDTPEEIKKKCFQLATALKESKYVVFYTGAGISTVSVIYYNTSYLQ